MKTYLVIPLIALTSCASHPKARVIQMPPSVPGTILPTETVGTVRYPENVKAYPVGRYIDPNDGFVMHEQHTIYRVETTAKWNLHPNGPAAAPMGPPLGVIDTAHRDSPINAEIIAEINKQKAATKALLNQGGKIDQSLSQVRTTLQQLQEQNLHFENENAAVQGRLDALTEDLRKTQAGAVPGTNDNTRTNEW